MTTVKVCKATQLSDSDIGFAVIAARYGDKWIFCRSKHHFTWEMLCCQRNIGERVIEAARRGLFELVGAVDADISQIDVFSVDTDGDISYGVLFFAVISTLNALPDDSEISEVGSFDNIPDELTYPEIHRWLYHHTQAWLNIQSNAGELWDVYDADRRPTGRVHRRGEPLDEGDYHLVVHVWLRNSRGEYLITKRTPNKGFPNMWESTGGSALAGDDSITAALREVREETGLVADPNCARCIMSFRRSDNFVDVWLIEQDFDLRDVVLQQGETCDVMYADRAEIEKLAREGRFVPYSYLTEVLDIADKV